MSSIWGRLASGLAVSAALLSPLAARAATLVETQSVSNNDPFIPSDVFNSIGSPTLAPFDSALGTLESFSLIITGDVTVDGTPTAGYSLTDNPDDVVKLSLTLATNHATLASDTLPLESGVIDFSYGVTDDANAADIAHLFLHQPLDYDLGNLNAVFGGNNDDFTAGPNGIKISETATLTYTYAPTSVPEPASWALMLVGFGGLGAAVRTRRQRDAGLIARPGGQLRAKLSRPVTSSAGHVSK
jgi:PEP-CTERM motif